MVSQEERFSKIAEVTKESPKPKLRRSGGLLI
jgi:hypothetical protein